MSPLSTLEQLAAALRAKTASSRSLVESCLARATDPAGEGARTYLRLQPEKTLRAADQADEQRANDAAATAYTGIPISVKDLFDVSGEVTTAGSKILANQAPAARDAACIARLRQAGFVIVGRTNMTEFAYSGLGVNPHYDTPRNPFDRAAGRIPGGSSSGAAISVTDGMAAVGLGTDTGGSCRIPAALTGLTGFKPTAARIPSDGAFPLSHSLDSIGSIGPSVNCCAIIDGVLANEAVYLQEFIPLSGLRIGIPQKIVLDGLDQHVAAAFSQALQRLSQAGATIVDAPFDEFAELATINAGGGLTAIESYAIHRELMAQHGADYDPRVRIRIETGAGQGEAEHRSLTEKRKGWIRRVEHHLEAFDIIVMPTVPTIAPTLDEVAANADYSRLNLLMLRNPAIINFLDGCAISLPCHQAGQAPVGIMLAARNGQDRRLLAVARSVEALLSN